jgi:hypothetical protein
MAQNSSPAPIPATSKLEVVTLQGEIVDSKCFFGAMKPGEGKTHKACATLCIRGGIPPMLITLDSSGQQTDYLLVDPEGRGLVGASLEAILPFVADAVEVSGAVEQRGELRLLRIDSTNTIRRL